MRWPRVLTKRCLELAKTIGVVKMQWFRALKVKQPAGEKQKPAAARESWSGLGQRQTCARYLGRPGTEGFLSEARRHCGAIGRHSGQDHLPAARHATHHANSPPPLPIFQSIVRDWQLRTAT